MSCDTFYEGFMSWLMVPKEFKTRGFGLNQAGECFPEAPLSN